MTIKVLIVDDSALIRGVMKEIISAQPDMEVVGAAPDPLAARELISNRLGRRLVVRHLQNDKPLVN